MKKRWLPLLAVFAVSTSLVWFSNAEARPGRRQPQPRPTRAPESLSAVGPTGWTTNQRLRMWLDAEEEFTPAKLQVLVDLARQDPAASAIVDQAMTKAQATTVEEFFRIFQTSAASSEASPAAQTGGEFSPGSYDTTSVDIAPEDQLLGEGEDVSKREPYLSRIQEIRSQSGVHQVSVENRTLFLRLHAFKNPSIYLKRDEGLQQSYESFIHELAHFTRFDILTEPDPVAFSSVREYDLAYHLKPGEEIDARIEGVQAVCRLIRDVPYFSSLPVQTESWFNHDCSLKQAREQFAGVIAFLGYSNEGIWVDRLQVGKSNDVMERAMLTTRLNRAQDLDSDRLERARQRIAVLDDRIARAEQLLR